MNLSPIIISVLFPFCLGLGWYDGYGYHIFSRHLKKYKPRNQYSTGFTLWKKQHFWRKRRISGSENVRKSKDILLPHRFATRKRFFQYSPYFPHYFGKGKSEQEERMNRNSRTKFNDFNYNVYSKDNHINAFVRRNFRRPPYYPFYFKSPSMYLSNYDDVGGHMHSGTSENKNNYVHNDVESSRKPLSSSSFGIISDIGLHINDLDKPQIHNKQLDLSGEDGGHGSTSGNGDVSFKEGSFPVWDKFQNSDKENTEPLSENPFIGRTGTKFGILETYPFRSNKFTATHPRNTKVHHGVFDTGFNNFGTLEKGKNTKVNQNELMFGPSLKNEESDFGDFKPHIKTSGEISDIQRAVVPDQTLFNPKNIHFHNKPLEFPNQGSRALHLQNSYNNGFGDSINEESTGFQTEGGGLFVNIAEEGSFNNDKSGCEGIETRRCTNDTECSCYGSFFCIEGMCSMMTAKNNDNEAEDSDLWWNR